jgi:TolB-like protein/Flp pilus assembly protein TadD
MSGDTEHSHPNPPPVDRLSQLWRRINQHKIVQWSVAYIAVAYALQQGLMLMGAAFDWPEAVLRASMLLLILGLPVIVTLAWYHGERASRNFSAAELTIISLLLVIGSVVFYALVQPQEEIAADQAPPVQQTGVESARTAAQSPATGISLAVLPFANLSGDTSQEFFSDGITEEITSALTKIPDLRVVGRTSAFEFKGQNRNLRDIGQALSATHLLEGSVRKEGDRVRITAQLVEAGKGVNVWTESYDRQLASVFATQEDIATAIAGALRMPLGLRPGEQLVSNRNIDQESYQQYLRAKTLVRGRLGGGGLNALNDAIALLEQVVARNPNYAPAWAVLAQAYRTVPNYSGIFGSASASLEERRRLVQSALSKAEPATRKALQLDPNLPEGYRNLANSQRISGKLVEEEELRLKALSLDPNDAETLNGYANFLVVVGRVKEALPISQQVHDLEPFIPINNRDLALVLWLNGQDPAAIDILRKVGNQTGLIAVIQAAAGRYGEAADTLASGPVGAAPLELRDEAVRLLRMAPAKVASATSIKRLGYFDFVYLYVGAPEQALDIFEMNLEAGWTNFANRILSHPSYGPVRKTERYKAYARKAGLVEYWRVKGWPAFCHPTTGDDFECS